MPEADGQRVLDEALEPCSRCLAKAVERAGEQADIVRARGIGEARRLLAVDALLNVAVEERI